MIKNFFKRKALETTSIQSPQQITKPQYQEQEVKFHLIGNNELSANGFLSIFDGLNSQGHSDLASAMAIGYYKQVAPLFTAVNKVSSEIACIPIKLYNEQTREFQDQHPLLELLNHPSAFSRTRREFMSDYSTYYLLNGTTYVMATGNPSKPPLEISIPSTSTVSVIPSQRDGYPEDFRMRTKGGDVYFKRDEEGKIFRYYWNGDMAEIYQVRDFNSEGSENQKCQGLSPLTPIYYEIEQYIAGNQHNLSMLQKGVNVGGIITTKVALDDEQYDKLEEEVQNFYTGASNAGRPMIGTGGINFENMSQSNKDMDYTTMRTQITTTIYNALGIPLPLINPDHMTLSNYDSAKIAFYEQTVLPLMDLLLLELQTMLFVRYPDLANGNWKLTYNPEDIPALEAKKIAKTEKLKNLGILTLNELRARQGYESVEGGDVLYKPMSDVPIGVDVFTEDNPKTPRYPKTRKFTAQLADIKDATGTPLYTEEEILNLEERYGLKEDNSTDA